MSLAEIPTTAQEVDGLLNELLSTWDQGGKEQLLEFLNEALTQDSQGIEDDSTSSSLSLILLTWLNQLLVNDQSQPLLFSSLLSQIASPSSTEEGSPDTSSEAGPSRQTSQGPSNNGRTVTNDLSDILLDVIWTADLQIDAHKDVASTYDVKTIIEDASEGESLDDQASRARSRLVNIVCDLVDNKVLNRIDVAERLELPLLHRIGLVPDERDLNRKAIRINTARLYKQQKFNLLREESEGFAGLVNELLMGVGPPTIAINEVDGDGKSSLRVIEQESIGERNERAQRVMNNISALIGYFDMDPVRVLDIILDIFSANVVHHWPFFLALLSASPWNVMRNEGNDESAQMDMDMSNGDDEWNLGSFNLKISNERGQHTCAQILGFKFAFYQHPETVRQNALQELYLVAAILIRFGQVRLVDLMPHLTPDEKGLMKLHEEYKNALSEKAMNAKGNALSMAAPLTADEGEGGALSDTRDGDKKKDPNAIPHVMPNQVVGLLKALLAIGEIKHALFLLGRYPWLCGAFPEIADLFCRLLNIIIEPSYSTVALSTQIEACRGPLAVPQRYKYDNKRQELIAAPSPRHEVTQIAPEPLASHSADFVFFFPQWKDKLPRCSNNSFLTDFVPFLRIVGPHLIRNTILFQRICRIGKVAMRTSSTDLSVKNGWLELIRNILLPALSMTSGNSGLVSEVWVIIRQLPYTERFSLYGEWKYSLYKRPELRVRQAEVEKEAKGILKRISSDNAKLSGRALAKASHANPTIFFTVALNQVQSYSNLIAPIVECAKYLTHFEYDVFGFNLIDALSNPEKDRTKQDGTSVSQWLQSLAAFTGTLYWRYGTMDCSPVLQYIANQLKENNIKDLVIIRELILKMAGIEPLQNLSDSQVAALTGGRLLRMEAMMVANTGIATRNRLALKKSSSRLLEAMQQSMMLMPLLILIAQQRQACIHLVPDNEAHLKYLGNLFDTCQEILFQYIEFLHNQLDPEAYSELIPSMEDLCRRFELEPAIASHLVRPRLTLQTRQLQAKENEERLRNELLSGQNKKSTPSEDIKMAVEEENLAVESKKEDKEVKGEDALVDDTDEKSKSKKEENEGEDVEMTADEQTKEEIDSKDEEEAEKPIWNTALSEMYQAAESILSDDVKEVIGIHFFSTFWQLSLSDISVPAERYQQEIRTLQKMVDENPEGGRSSNLKVRAQAQDSIRLLRTELKEQTLAHQLTKSRLKNERKHWFTRETNRNDIVYALLQNCFIPRALLSPTDAIFAGRFIQTMHSNSTYNFDTLKMYDKIFMEQLPVLIFSTTENEARNLARFLQTIMNDLTNWFKNEGKFKSEALGTNLPGFQVKWGDRYGDEEIPEEDMMQFDQFKSIIRKWHNMLQSTFIECLRSHEYMRIRNCIVIMTRIASYFPLWEIHGVELTETISAVVQEEERGDLKVLGQGLLATLKKESKGWIPMPNKKVVASPKTKGGKEEVEKVKAVESKSNDVKATKEEKDEKQTLKKDGKEQKPAPSSRSTSTHQLPPRPGSFSNTASRDNRVSSTNSVNEKISGKDDSTSVQAARQAALASMNPPKGPVRDRERDRAGERERGSQRNTANDSPLRSRNDGNSTPRSQSDRSRDPSPRVGERGSNARSNDVRSRAPSDDAGKSNSYRRDRERDIDREDRYNNSRSDRTRDRDSNRSKDTRDSDRDRDRKEEFERERERIKREAINQVRGGLDDRHDRRGGDRDRYPSSSASNDRDRDRRNGNDDKSSSTATNDTNRKRNGDRNHDSNVSNAYRQSNARRGPASQDQGRSNPSKSDDHRSTNTQRDERRDRDRDGDTRAARNGEQSNKEQQQTQNQSKSTSEQKDKPSASSTSADIQSTASPSGLKKRTLFDRLTMEQNSSGSSPASPSGGGDGADGNQGKRDSPKGSVGNSDRRNDGRSSGRETDSQQPPNKRARTSLAGDDDRSERSGQESSRGISIQGQARAGSAASNSRSNSQQYSRGGGGGGYGNRGADDTYRPSEQSRSASGGGGNGRDRGGGNRDGRDRDRRRRERRSGA